MDRRLETVIGKHAAETLWRAEAPEFQGAALDLCEAHLHGLQVWAQLTAGGALGAIRAHLAPIANELAEAMARVGEAATDSVTRVRAWSIFYGLQRLALGAMADEVQTRAVLAAGRAAVVSIHEAVATLEALEKTGLFISTDLAEALSHLDYPLEGLDAAFPEVRL